VLAHPSDTRSSLTASGAIVCAINAASSVIARWRCCSPTSSHNATAGAGLPASSRRSCTIDPRDLIISLGQDDTPNQRPQDLSHRQQIRERSERARHRRSRRRLQIGPGGWDQQMTAVRQHQDQLQPPPPAHPAHQLERATLPRVP
jgi:hypothetical protein